MVEKYFGFSAAPFKLSPDARFFFGSKSHTKAMAYLHYGLQQAEGFIVITGEIGAGKSMLIGHMLEQLNDDNVLAAHLLTSNLKAEDLLPHILSSFQIEAQDSGRASELEAFEDFLYDNVNRGRRVLLVVDEAQNLPVETLEELRMLTNINHQGMPLFQVFLVGQPEFRGIIAGSNMEQLRQRIIATYHLEALDQAETREYIEHRLAIVGRVDKPAFTEEAFEAIYKVTNGVPRRINTLCTRILLFCALEKRDLINSVIVSSVADELQKEVYAPAQSHSPATHNEITSAKTKKAAEQTQPAKQTQPIKPAQSTSTTQGTKSIKAVKKVKNINEDVIIPFENLAQEENTSTNKIDEVREPSDKNSLRDVFGVDSQKDKSQKNIVANYNGLDAEVKNAATLKDVAKAISELSKQQQPIEHKQTNGSLNHENGVAYNPGKPLAKSAAKSEKASVPTSAIGASVMDRVLSLRTDLHEAHAGNRKVYNAIADMEEKSVNNIIQIERHIQKASTIIDDLQSEL